MNQQTTPNIAQFNAVNEINTVNIWSNEQIKRFIQTYMKAQNENKDKNKLKLKHHNRKLLHLECDGEGAFECALALFFQIGSCWCLTTPAALAGVCQFWCFAGTFATWKVCGSVLYDCISQAMDEGEISATTDATCEDGIWDCMSAGGYCHECLEATSCTHCECDPIPFTNMDEPYC
eukprot:241718_1